MLGSTVLEVVIGLVFLYLSLSLVCSAVNEFYSALMSRRAAHLRDSLYLIFNKDDPKGLAFLLEFFSHPLISGLSPSKRKLIATASAPTTVHPIAHLPWYQRAVVFPARVVASFLASLAGWSGAARGALRWIVSAIRDPFGVGGVMARLRSELADVARSTPNYIPDRAFSGAIFAVLASDSGATRRLQVELSIQLDLVARFLPTMADADDSKSLAARLEEVRTSLRATVDHATTPEEIITVVQTGFEQLLASIPVVDASNPDSPDARERGRVAARALIAKARDAVLAVGPRIPSPEQVRDHILLALDVSMNRLIASLATLSEGTLRARSLEGIKNAMAAIAATKAGGPMSLEDAKALANRTFASIRGTLDGLNAEVDWSKASAWVDRELAALTASEGDLITLAKLRDAVAALPESDIRAALLSLMDEVGDDLDRVKRNIQVWFNDSMERVSGRYKWNTQVLLTIIAVVIACVLNADTFAVAGRLWTDSALRANVDAVAQTVDSTLMIPQPIADAKTKDAEQAASDLNLAAHKILKESDLPLGWSAEELKGLGVDGLILTDFQSGKVPDWDHASKSLRKVLETLFGTPKGLYKLLGLALTVVAVSMGAPFWFDVLNKLVNVRTAGQRPKKTADEHPAPASKA